MKALQKEVRKALEKELGKEAKSWLDEKVIIITSDDNEGEQ